MRKLALVLALILPATEALAHRSRAPVVTPVVVDGVKLVARRVVRSSYCAGVVDAVPAAAATPAADTIDDASSYRPLWRVEVYRVPVRQPLEEDAQWVFIRSMSAGAGVLRVVNERGERYTVSLATHAVRREP